MRFNWHRERLGSTDWGMSITENINFFLGSFGCRRLAGEPECWLLRAPRPLLRTITMYRVQASRLNHGQNQRGGERASTLPLGRAYGTVALGLIHS